MFIFPGSFLCELMLILYIFKFIYSPSYTHFYHGIAYIPEIMGGNNIYIVSYDSSVTNIKENLQSMARKEYKCKISWMPVTVFTHKIVFLPMSYKDRKINKQTQKKERNKEKYLCWGANKHIAGTEAGGDDRQHDCILVGWPRILFMRDITNEGWRVLTS